MTDYASRTIRNSERQQKMVAMYEQGLTLETISQQFNITRERVRQVLCAAGVGRFDGGQHKKLMLVKASNEQKLEAQSMARYGLARSDVTKLRRRGLVQVFERQKRNAADRGIEWRLDLATWFGIWDASGNIDLRGRGRGKFVMSRINDAGPYEAGNVYIQLATENSAEARAGKVNAPAKNTGVWCVAPGTGKPWLAKVGKKRVGYFATEQEAAVARASYLAANPSEAPRKFGRGRGWTYVSRLKRRPYKVQIAGVKSSFHATREEAEAAYQAGCEAILKARTTDSAPAHKAQPAIDSVAAKEAA